MSGDFAENWAGLYELFVSVSGLKLRLNIPDTAIIRGGRIIGWFYTNRDGVVTRCSLHEVSPMGLFIKLTGQQTADQTANPNQYVALGHYSSGIARPLKQHELQFLLSQTLGPYEQALVAKDPCVELPFCIQAYTVPLRDLRYMVTYGGPDKDSCTVFTRRFSSRYTHALDDPACYVDMAQTGFSEDTEERRPLTADELLVESQLVSMGLLEARGLVSSHNGDESNLPLDHDYSARQDAARPASQKAKAETTRLIQNIVSFVERAHGLRIQGMVAEFIQVHPNVFALLAVHAVQWDPRSSKGRLGTFTERWNDFVTGMGPAPAPRPPTKANHAPGLLQSADKSILVMSERAVLQHNAGALNPGHAFPVHRAPAISPAHVRRHGEDNDRHAHVRPGSAPATVLQRFRPHANQPYGGPNNGGATFRGAVASARRGAGGNPTAQPPSPDSYTLWTAREQLSTHTVAGSLTLELEVMKERLQRQTDVVARAEAALSQLAVSSQATAKALQRQVEDAQRDTEAAVAGRREIDVGRECDRLTAERHALKAEVANLKEELHAVRSDLVTDRATLAVAVRSAQNKEESLEDVVARLRSELEASNTQVQALQRRLEEEQEVTEATRSQLYDYKQMVTMLQSQLRRGKNKPASSGPAGNASNVYSSFNATSMGPMQALQSMQADDHGDTSSAQAGANVYNYGSNAVALGAGGGSGGGAASRPSSGVAPPAFTGKRMGNSPLGGPGQQGPAAAQQLGSRPILNSTVRRATKFPLPEALQEATPTSPTAQPAPFSPSRAPTVPPTAAAAAGAPHPHPLGGPPSVSLPVLLGVANPNQITPASLLSLIASGPREDMLDGIRDVMGELRRMRKSGLETPPAPVISTVQQPLSSKAVVASKAPPTKASLAEAAEAAAAAKAAQKLWLPSYDHLVLQDLFTACGDMTERMLETQGHLVTLFKSVEDELYDVYTYYAHLGKVVHHEDKLAMNLHQFSKVAAVSNCGLTPEHEEELFLLVADRAMAYHFDAHNRPSEPLIFFLEFIETVCRLAAAKYEWRPPENPDEADDPIEQPEVLKSVALANISELPTATIYNVGPTAKISKPATIPGWSTRDASSATVSRSTSPHRGRPGNAHGGPGSLPGSGDASRAQSASPGRPGSLSPGAPAHPATPAAVSGAAEPGEYVEPAPLCELGPQPSDVVLYCVIKTFLFLDLLPNARHYNMSGSIKSKQRAQLGRIISQDFWLK